MVFRRLQRIAARPGTKTYGRLSVMVQHLCHAKALFDIDGKSFVPPPKVTATAIHIQPRVEPLAQGTISDCLGASALSAVKRASPYRFVSA